MQGRRHITNVREARGCGLERVRRDEADGRVSRHVVLCPNCLDRFELFTAPWCGHRDFEPSKICPHCGRCLCRHPSYGDRRLWMTAPIRFSRNGFKKLFVLYV